MIRSGPYLLLMCMFVLSCTDSNVNTPIDENGAATTFTDQPSDLFHLKLKYGQIRCAAMSPCSGHEWRATFEVEVLNEFCDNILLQEDSWEVTFYAQKSQNQPSNWGEPLGKNTCGPTLGLETIDGEWYPVISPLVWWVRARVTNANLSIDQSLVMPCYWTYTDPDDIYDCEYNYGYGLTEHTGASFVIGSWSGCN